MPLPRRKIGFNSRSDPVSSTKKSPLNGSKDKNKDSRNNSKRLIKIIKGKK